MLSVRFFTPMRAARDTSGAVAVIFGLSAMVLLTMIGVALDASRAYNISSRIQNVLDAAALAAAKKLSLEEGSNTEVQQAALNHLEMQQSQFKIWGAIPSNPNVTIDRAKSAVSMSVDVTMSSIAGSLSSLLPQIAFTPTATAIYEVKRVELAMVLDITGSMNWSGSDGKPKLDGLKEAAEDIIKVLSNTTTAAGLVRVGLVPYSASVNAGPYFDAVTHDGSGDTCVVERSGSYAYTDNSPGGGAHLGTSDTSVQGYYSCPDSSVVPLTDINNATQRNFLIDRVKALAAVGGTAGHIGAAWGWYMVSPNWSGIWPSASVPKPYSPTVTKAVLLMTDGDFNSAYGNGGGGLGSSARTDVLVPGSSPYQAKQLCDNMKAAGIRIYSVAFMAPIAAESLLKDCSGESNFYDASNTTQLKAAFRDIASKLTSLKLSQ